ncbi:hypothetical protein T11_12531, partial [Trichinella zimbabwensis]
LTIRHLYGDRYLHSAALETGFSALELFLAEDEF